MDSIYLDHNATTPIHPEVVAAMAECYAQGYANPASQHRPGQRARQVLEDARSRIAEILGADLTGPSGDRLIFTGSGTEANSLAVLGIARAGGTASLAAGGTASLAAGGTEPGRVVVSAIEHASVIEPAEYLMEHGWRYDGLGVDGDGVVRTEALPDLLAEPAEPARIVGVLAANHETGVLQPIARLAEICNEAGVPLHTDAVQIAGKLPVNFREWGVAAMSVAAHKFRGPTGIGALIVRHGVAIEPLLFGGHQQGGLRPGTEAVALAVGMLAALEIWQRDHREHARQLAKLRNRFEDGLRAGFPEIVVHGSAAERLPQTSNVAFPGLDGQILLMAMDTAGVACSVGSACSNGSTELSPTLRAMDLSSELVRCSLRFSLGSTTTGAEIDEAVRRSLHVCGELRL